MGYICVCNYYSVFLKALSITNGLQKLKGTDLRNEDLKDIAYKFHKDGASFRINSEDFQITEKYELGQMSLMYFGKIGNILFYINICTYLYGDLAIYSSAVPKSLRNVVCSLNNSKNSSLSDFDLCWASSSLTRMDVYRIFVVIFGAFVLPFLFFSVTRSRWLQLLTVCLRWLGFLLMLSLSIERAILLRKSITVAASLPLWNPSVYTLFSQPEPIPQPPMFQPHNIPNLFGVCVYVFMCHHSIPGIVTPIGNKHRILYKVFIPVFITVLLFNLFLSSTAIIAFNHIEDLYTLNFIPDQAFIDISHIPYTIALIFGYFLCLFPVFALTSSYPIIGTSLLGNIYSLCSFFPVFQGGKAKTALKYSLPFIVALPPLCIALITDNVGYLTGFTGAIFGSGIQYIIPGVLVYKARRQLSNFIISSSNSVVTIRTDGEHQNNSSSSNDMRTVHDDAMIQTTSSNTAESNEVYNSTECLTTAANNLPQTVSIIDKYSYHRLTAKFTMHASPFQSIAWILFIFVWAIFCIVIVLIDKIHHI
uniref:Amino acid transporter transmembrane domain-containing protein n=1 Tax=Trichobilharzia regenti TaxID=157069 RepID=A0AA85K1C5_TRIRE|nr:unnamed protein product [Trichobilharzia regenti]